MLDLNNWQNAVFKTRSGTNVVLLTTNAPGDQPIVGYIDYGDSILTAAWDLNGSFNPRSALKSSVDLVRLKLKRCGWLNVFQRNAFNREREVTDTSPIYPTRDMADAVDTTNRVACIYVEWEE